MSTPRIGIILSTTREGRFADRPAQWLLAMANRRDDAHFEIVDLRDYPMSFFDRSTIPGVVPPPDADIDRWVQKMAGLDGYLFVTAEYNHSISAVLKNALDFLRVETARKPAAFLGYGGVGGARAVEQLRLICVELSMAPTRTAIHIGMEPFLGLLRDGKDFADYDYLVQSARDTLDELVWWARTLRAGREAEILEQQAA
ncbi:MAG: NADPH-dependent FMN reductase [Devosia sp.]